MHSRFTRLRVRVWPIATTGAVNRILEQWLLIEWPKTEKEPTKYWLSNLPESIPLRQLVALGKQRWIIERDYQELKAGTWSGPFRRDAAGAGFHHHATLAIAAYGFLVRERCLFPPPPGSPPMRAANLRLRLPHVQSSYAPRGSAGANRTA